MFCSQVRRRESGDEKTDFWKDDEEAEERIAGVSRDEDWVKSDYVDSVDYDDGNDEDEAGTAASLGRKKTRHMHGLMKEMDALLGAEGADDMDAEAASVPPHVFAEEAARLLAVATLLATLLTEGAAALTVVVLAAEAAEMLAAEEALARVWRYLSRWLGLHHSLRISSSDK